MTARKSDFTRRALTADGYQGWTTFSTLRPGGGTKIEHGGGTYVVLGVTDDPPICLEVTPASWFMGLDQTVPPEQLEVNWVAGARVLYIGKADDLDERLRCMAAFGAGRRVAHRGGRLVWQRAEASALLVDQMPVRAGFTPKTDEDDMIDCFRQAYGQPPFANHPDRMGR